MKKFNDQMETRGNMHLNKFGMPIGVFALCIFGVETYRCSFSQSRFSELS